MKLITWNVQWTLGIDGGYGAERVVKAARDMADFDVLCLQEVADNFGGLKGSSGENQFALFAQLLPGFTAIEGVALDAPDGTGGRRRFGNMLLSRLPVGRILRHQLTWGAAAGVPSMPRVAIEAVIEAPSGPARVMTTHLEYSTPILRNPQIEMLRTIHAEACARVDAPPVARYNQTYDVLTATKSMLLCGDFNMDVADPGKARLEAAFSDGFTPPLVDVWQAKHPGVKHPDSFCIYDQSFKPAHCCDFVFATPDMATRASRISYDTATRVSDHQPVLVEFD